MEICIENCTVFNYDVLLILEKKVNALYNNKIIIFLTSDNALVSRQLKTNPQIPLI